MPSIWANFDNMFELFQDLFFAFLLWQIDTLGKGLDISPNLKYWPHPFLPSPYHPLPPLLSPQKKFQVCQTSFYEQPASKFWELDSPLKCNLIQKSNPHFLKKQKILFLTLNSNTFECWNMNIQLQNLKIKGDLGVF